MPDMPCGVKAYFELQTLLYALAHIMRKIFSVGFRLARHDMHLRRIR